MSKVITWLKEPACLQVKALCFISILFLAQVVIEKIL